MGGQISRPPHSSYPCRQFALRVFRPAAAVDPFATPFRFPRTGAGRIRLTSGGAQVEAGVFRDPRLNLGAPDAQFRCADAITALLADDIELMWAAVPIEYVPGKEHLGIQMVLGHRAGERILEGEGGPSHVSVRIFSSRVRAGLSVPGSGVLPLLFSRAPSRAGGAGASGSLPSMRSRM